MTAISLSSRPKLARKARLRWDSREGKHMLVYPERGLLLNAVAAAAVQRCDGVRTVRDIVCELRADFAGADEETVERDVLALLEQLHARTVLEIDP